MKASRTVLRGQRERKLPALLGDEKGKINMIQYEQSVNLKCDRKEALSEAKRYFMNHGFKLEENESNELIVTGKGMNSSRQNPIRGLTKGKLIFSNTEINFSGELGGVEFMKKFLYFFPPFLALVIIVPLAITAYLKKDFPTFGLFIPLLAISPWIFLAPMMAGSIKKKTEFEIETLLSNIALKK